MTDVILGDMYDSMLEAAARNGPQGVAFCMPIEPIEIRKGLFATVYLFHADGSCCGDVDSRVLSVYAGLNAERTARENGREPRVTTW